MVSIDVGANAPAGQTRIQRLYSAVWRWHFYAGLYVIPFLFMLAVTGLVILWVTAISPEFGDRMAVTPGDKVLTVTEQEAAVVAAVPGTVDKYVAPIDAAKPALFRVQTADGAVMVALDPYTGTVVHQRPEAGTWNDWATDLHGTLLLKGAGEWWGDLLIEIAVSLAVMLVVSGFWMAWPRNGEGFSAMFVPKLAARGRAFWKSTHRSVGTWIGIVLLGFLISGLAWAGIWGGKFVQPWSAFPAEKWGAPLSDQTHASQNHTAVKEVPWVLELTPLPASGSTVGVEILPPGTPVMLETVVTLARAIGFDGRVQVTKPSDPTGVWTLSRDSMSYDSPDPTADRTVHIDQYTGKVLADVRYEDYPWVGKAMAVGIALHEGQMGPWNIAANIAFCLAVIFLCVGSVVMWWIRRPVKAGRLAAPPLPTEVPVTGWMVLALLVLSLAIPVLGLTLLAVLALDLVVLQAIAPLKRLVS